MLAGHSKDISERNGLETKEDAKQFINSHVTAHEHIQTSRVNPGSLLAIKYLLWRIQTREGYYLDRVPPEKARQETRDVWPIPTIDLEVSSRTLLYVSSRTLLSDLPVRPSLKKAATLDVLGLTPRISFSLENVQRKLPGVLLDDLVFNCSILSLGGEMISFRFLM